MVGKHENPNQHSSNDKAKESSGSEAHLSGLSGAHILREQHEEDKIHKDNRQMASGAEKPIAAFGETPDTVPVIADFNKTKPVDDQARVSPEKSGQTIPDPLLMRDVLMEENRLLGIGAEAKFAQEQAVEASKSGAQKFMDLLGKSADMAERGFAQAPVSDAQPHKKDPSLEERDRILERNKIMIAVAERKAAAEENKSPMEKALDFVNNLTRMGLTEVPGPNKETFFTALMNLVGEAGGPAKALLEFIEGHVANVPLAAIQKMIKEEAAKLHKT